MRAHYLGLGVLVVLAGCGGGATVSESQCYAGDWQTLGYRDGVNGLRSTQLLEHQDACVRHGVVPDRNSYLAGWHDGVAEYCRPNNAFVVGEQGWGHNNVCPDNQRGQFESAYREGRTLYVARSEVADLERAIYQKELRHQQIKAEVITSATEQLDPLLTTARRVELIAWTHRLIEEKSAIEYALPELRAHLAAKAHELRSIEHSLASAG